MSNIESIVITDEFMDMCEIEIDHPCHRFYANGVVVSNSAQELRVPANLSREPVWCTAFTTPGGDVHRSTAISIWGEEKYNKDYRKMAKKANFGILYGMGAPSFADDPMFHMNLEQAQEFMDKYKGALPTLFQWEERIQRKGRREGTVYTYFGRPRRVKGYFDEGQRAFGNRTCVNTTTQGCEVFDKRVLTSKGYIKIGELYNEFISLNQSMDSWNYRVWNGFKWCEFFPVYREKDYLCKIHLSNGQIFECDSRHKMRVLQDNTAEFVSIKDMQSGDKICFSKLSSRPDIEVSILSVTGEFSVHSKCYKESMVFNRDELGMLAYLYGSILGDGHISYTGSDAGLIYLYYGESKKKNIKLIREFLDKRGINYSDIWKENHIAKSGVISPIGCVTVHCLPLVDAVQKLTGDLGGNVYSKRLGERVFQFDRFLLGCTLKGLHDTDGNKDRGGFNLANEGLVRDIGLALRFFGYSTYISCKDRATSIEVHNCAEYLREVNGIDVYRECDYHSSEYNHKYRVSTTSYHTSVLRQQEVLGRSILGESDYVVARRVFNGGSCELETFRRIIKKLETVGNIYQWDDYDYYEVKDIEFTGEEVDTFTLSVLDDSHQFDSEGAISKNTSSDILKIVMCRLWKNMLNHPDYKDDVKWALTVHDEVDYIVKASRANEIGKMIIENQRFQLKEWPVDIDTELSFGWSFGSLSAWEPDEDGWLKPKLE